MTELIDKLFGSRKPKNRDTASKDQEPPTQVQELPAQVQEPPAQVQEPPAQVQEPPAQVQESPAQVQEPPTQVQELPTQVQGTKNQGQEIPTVPILKKLPEIEKSLPSDEIHLEFPQFIAGCYQSIGKLRDHNEDALFTLTANLAGDRGQIPLGLYIVADGMGGHKHGEIASELAVRTISSQIIRKVFMSLLGPKPTSPNESIQEIMQESALEAHRLIVKNAPGGGTTMTSILILDQQMTIAHIGDSRAYMIALDGSMQVLTRDHSLVMRMIELGQLTASEAAVHPQRNVLYRALGQGETFIPDISSYPLPESGYLLLCSDGLWGVVSENEISRLVTTSPSPQLACQFLANAANEAGGPDNITAILVRLPD